MQYHIEQRGLSPELKAKIDQDFSQHAIEQVGFDGFSKSMAFCIHAPKDQEPLGVCVIQLFWGNLHIKYFIVQESHRDAGIGSILLERVLDYGKEKGCRIAFVETMSFQAPNFYQKHGFKVDLKRDGFDADISYYYLSKTLK